MSTKWDSLAVVNGLIGLTHRGDPSWPGPLADAGYQVWWLEQGVTTHEGTCTADLILHSRLSKSTLVVEAKCGGLREKQHKCYRAITALDLKDSAGIPNTDRSDYVASVMYATSQEKSETLHVGMAVHGALPVVVFNKEAICRKGEAPFSVEHLETLFGGGIGIDGCEPPMQFMPFDTESTKATVARAVLPVVVALIRRGEAWMPFDDFMEHVVPVWKHIGTAVQGGLRKRARSALATAPNEMRRLYTLDFARAPARITFEEDLSVASPGAMNAAVTDIGALVRNYLIQLDANEAQSDIFDELD